MCIWDMKNAIKKISLDSWISATQKVYITWFFWEISWISGDGTTPK
jgi:hypothetical protein